MKGQKGITLVALIITIVVLLILAVAAITTINDYNIVDEAKNVGNKWNQSVKNEQTELKGHETQLNTLLQNVYKK